MQRLCEVDTVLQRKKNQRILDEFRETTGMHRKAAIRLLDRRSVFGAQRLGRPRRYGPEAAEALVKVWEVRPRICSKLLMAIMPDLVDALERHGELQPAPELRAQLVKIGASSIDRLPTLAQPRKVLQEFGREAQRGYVTDNGRR